MIMKDALGALNGEEPNESGKPARETAGEPKVEADWEPVGCVWTNGAEGGSGAVAGGGLSSQENKSFGGSGGGGACAAAGGVKGEKGELPLARAARIEGGTKVGGRVVGTSCPASFF